MRGEGLALLQGVASLMGPNVSQSIPAAESCANDTIVDGMRHPFTALAALFASSQRMIVLGYYAVKLLRLQATQFAAAISYG